MKIGVNTYGLSSALSGESEQIWDELKTMGVSAIEPVSYTHLIFRLRGKEIPLSMCCPVSAGKEQTGRLYRETF